jgi:zinc D-Ala-D-Ala carboxypeptidase
VQLSEHFSLAEFIISSKALSMGIENTPTEAHMKNLKNLAACMEQVRALFNRPIEITSAYRNPQVNAAVGGVKKSAHAEGHAADFHVDGLHDLEAAKRIRDSGLVFDQLIYEENRCVHISFDPEGSGTGKPRRHVRRQPGGPNTPVFEGLEP